MYLEEHIDIAAPPARVWEATVDLARWPEWTPTVTTVELLDPPPVRPGHRARLTQPGNRPAVWTVTEVDPERSFRWEMRTFGMPVEAIHRMEPTATGTRVTLAIDVTGPTAPLLGRFVMRVSRQFVPQEAEALRRRCEAP